MTTQHSMIYDAIIVGARCAGAPTAMLLARKGYRVLLVDRATFPSDIMSGHMIHPAGVVHLQRWGLLEKVVASNCPLIGKMRFDFGPVSLVGSTQPKEGIGEACAIRRKYLDKILVDAAVEAGVELREGFSVQEILMDGDQVVGIRGRTKKGAVVTEKARIVIGADGMNSFVARSVASPTYNTRPSLTGCYYSYWSDLPLDKCEAFVRDGRFISTEPTNDGLTQIFVQFPYHKFQEFRTDVEGNFLKSLELVPDLAESVRNAQRVEPFVGTCNNTNFFRKAFGPGWALVGDARYHRDPVTAQGITNSFEDAQGLAEAIDLAFSEHQPLEVALAAYEQQRNEEVMPMYEMTCRMAMLELPPPEMQQLFFALSDNPTDTKRFFGVIGGTVPIPEFYSPANIQRIIEASYQPSYSKPEIPSGLLAKV